MMSDCGPGYEIGEFYDTVLPSYYGSSGPASSCLVRLYTAAFGDRLIAHCHMYVLVWSSQ